MKLMPRIALVAAVAAAFAAPQTALAAKGTQDSQTAAASGVDAKHRSTAAKIIWGD